MPSEQEFDKRMLRQRLRDAAEARRKTRKTRESLASVEEEYGSMLRKALLEKYDAGTASKPARAEHRPAQQLYYTAHVHTTANHDWTTIDYGTRANVISDAVATPVPEKPDYRRGPGYSAEQLARYRENCDDDSYTTLVCGCEARLYCCTCPGPRERDNCVMMHGAMGLWTTKALYAPCDYHNEVGLPDPLPGEFIFDPDTLAMFREDAKKDESWDWSVQAVGQRVNAPRFF